jgi:hypothetical protein
MLSENLTTNDATDLILAIRVRTNATQLDPAALFSITPSLNGRNEASAP